MNLVCGPPTAGVRSLTPCSRKYSTLCLAGLPTTIAPSEISDMTPACAPILALEPTVTCGAMADCPPITTKSPISTDPAIPHCAAIAQYRPMRTLCATCTRSSRRVPDPITVSRSVPRSIVLRAAVLTAVPGSSIRCLLFPKPGASLRAFFFGPLRDFSGSSERGSHVTFVSSDTRQALGRIRGRNLWRRLPLPQRATLLSGPVDDAGHMVLPHIGAGQPDQGAAVPAKWTGCPIIPLAGEQGKHFRSLLGAGATRGGDATAYRRAGLPSGSAVMVGPRFGR
jgi:hypothetical protein